MHECDFCGGTGDRRVVCAGCAMEHDNAAQDRFKEKVKAAIMPYEQEMAFHKGMSRLFIPYDEWEEIKKKLGL